MRRKDASFSLRLLTSAVADRPDVDAALALFVKNTLPFLRTKTNQIRTKIRSPKTPEGSFYFAAFYRGDTVIGFAMFGHYPRARLVVVDHMVIERAQRGHAAFYIFVQLLQDVIQSLALDVDFTAAEVEEGVFGDEQSGGAELVRLLGQVGFGEVHAEYVLPNMEPRDYEARYEGVLMLRGPEKLHNIRREDLNTVYHTILFDHYLPWYRDFFGGEITGYERHLLQLYREFELRLHNKPIVGVNGPRENVLTETPPPSPSMHALRLVGAHVALFALTAAIITGALFVLKPPPYVTLPLIIGILAVFAGIVLVSRGGAVELLEWISRVLPADRRKSHYRQGDAEAGSSPTGDRKQRSRKKDSDARSTDKPTQKGGGNSATS